MNKTKFSLTITAMVLVAMIAIVSIIAVFAARTQNFTSSITVSYTSREVQGTASAQYILSGDTGSEGWQDMVDEDGNTELNFELDKLNNASLNPDDIELRDVNDYVVFKYDFTNDGPHPYELTLTYEDDETPDENVNVYTMVTPQIDAFYACGFDTEYVFDNLISYRSYQEVAYSAIGEKFTNTITTTVVPDGQLRIYILLVIENWGLDASFSGSMNFELDGTNAKDYDEDFYYYTNGESATITGVAKGTPTFIEGWDCYVNIIDSGILNVPTIYNGLPVKTIGAAAFVRQHLTQIASWGVVENLNCGAFCYGYSGELTIPGSVKNITAAFYGCGITSLTLQEGVENINSEAFYECMKLKEMHLPNSLTYIGVRAFRDCESLSEITIPIDVKYIEYGAFSDFEELSNVTINSRTVCENLVDWGTGAESSLNIGGKIRAVEEIPGLLNYNDWGKYFTKSTEKDADGYWVYTKVANS